MKVPEQAIEQNRVVSEQVFAIVEKHDAPDENFRKEALSYLASLGMPDDVAVPMIDQYSSPWMFYFSNMILGPGNSRSYRTGIDSQRHA